MIPAIDPFSNPQGAQRSRCITPTGTLVFELDHPRFRPLVRVTLTEFQLRFLLRRAVARFAKPIHHGRACAGSHPGKGNGTVVLDGSAGKLKHCAPCGFFLVGRMVMVPAEGLHIS